MTPHGAIATHRPDPRRSSHGARTVIALVTAAMFADATFYAVIAPLLPHYRDALSLGHLEIAMLFAAHPVGTVIAALPAARLVNARGSAAVMTAGLLSLGIATIVFGLADSFPILVAGRFVQGASAALVWCAGLARIQGAVAPERRGAALGLAGAAAGAGSLAGPGFAALSSLIGIAATLITLGALSFVLALAIRLAGELPGERREGAPAARTRSLLSLDVTRPAGVIFICGAVLGAVSTIGPLRLSDLGAGVVLIAATFVLSAFGEVVIAPAAGHASDRVGRTLPIRLALIAAVPLLFVVGFAGSVPVTALGIALIGSVVAVLWPLGTALLADRAGRRGRAAAEISAVSLIAWSIGLGGESVLCGALAGAFGNGAGLAFLAVPCLLGLAFLGGEEPRGEVRLPGLDPQTVNPVN
ncbi:MAG: MFS transporter [Actinobacteria bacterium]|nr:MFS transporter [Actinomycetota bacterium]